MDATPPSAWSFNLRARPGCVSDTDSDAETDLGIGAGHHGESNEARLVREMDLSRRPETVQYRPNPWSIARINAASRPTSLPKPALAGDLGQARPPAKPQPKPIVEAFRRQAHRARIARDANIADKPTCVTLTNRGNDNPRNAQNTASACPRRAGLVDTPHAASKPQTDSTTPALEREQSAHIPTLSGQLAPAPLPLKPRRIDHAPRSSPVRPVMPRGAPEIGDAVRHSSSCPVPGKIASHASYRVSVSRCLVPQHTPCAHHYRRSYQRPCLRPTGPQRSSMVFLL